MANEAPHLTRCDDCGERFETTRDDAVELCPGCLVDRLRPDPTKGPLCSWCDREADLQWSEHGQTEYSCAEHGLQYHPELRAVEIPALVVTR